MRILLLNCIPISNNITADPSVPKYCKGSLQLWNHICRFNLLPVMCLVCNTGALVSATFKVKVKCAFKLPLLAPTFARAKYYWVKDQDIARIAKSERKSVYANRTCRKNLLASLVIDTQIIDKLFIMTSCMHAPQFIELCGCGLSLEYRPAGHG